LELVSLMGGELFPNDSADLTMTTVGGYRR
jgi:hypothetical protein